MIERLDTRDVPAGELVFFPGNARRGNVAKIRESVRRLGQYRSVVVRVTDDALVILAGNHTVKAMRAEGYETVRCELIRCTDDEAIRVNVADNRIPELAADDTDALLELLSSLDGDYEGTGWAEEDISALLTPSGDADKGDGDPGSQEDAYHLAVVIVCASETDQQATCEDLTGRGYEARPVRLGETVLRDARA
jgi:ParB-like nuclease domain